MKKISLTSICVLLALFLFPFVNNAQTTIEYGYNDSGDRISRTIINLKSASFTNGSNESTQEPLVEQIGLQEAKIYPNPTKGLLRVELPSLQNQNGIIRVFDSNGKLIIEKTASISNQVELFNHPSGFYFMQIIIGGEKKEWKIIKE